MALAACALWRRERLRRLRAAPAAEVVSVLWWRSQSGSIGDLLAKFVVDFNDANPGIVAGRVPRRLHRDDEQGHRRAAANAPPDMLLVGDGQYLPLAATGSS